MLLLFPDGKTSSFFIFLLVVLRGGRSDTRAFLFPTEEDFNDYNFEGFCLEGDYKFFSAFSTTYCFGSSLILSTAFFSSSLRALLSFSEILDI